MSGEREGQVEEARKAGPRILVEPLAPAVIWMAYFGVVYLFAEAACQVGLEGWELFGLEGVSAFTVVATVITGALIAYFTVRAWRQWSRSRGDTADERQARALGLIGILSGLIFITATISLGAPALVLVPC